MKKIQVATDFSETAEAAAETAVALARKLGAEIFFTHAAFMDEAVPNAYETATGRVEEFRRMLQDDFAHRRAALAAMAERARKQGLEARHALLDGLPVETLCQTATEEEVDLLVLGSHGRTGIKRILLGSVAERVVRHATQDVLIARPPAVAPEGFRRVLVCTDFSECAERALEHALALAADDGVVDLLHCWYVDSIVDGALEPSPVYGATVKMLAMDSDKRGHEAIDAVSDRRARTFRFHSREGRPTSAVQSFLHDAEPAYDLVAVGTHGRTGIERALLGSVAEVTVRYSPCSVLVAR